MLVDAAVVIAVVVAAAAAAAAVDVVAVDESSAGRGRFGAARVDGRGQVDVDSRRV